MVEHTLNALIAVTKDLAVGTNLGLLQFLWMLVSGALLGQRGAIFPALKFIGLTDGEARRAWGAFRGGKWQVSELIRVWRSYIEGQTAWEVHRHEGYRAVTVDVTAFWRPRLKGCPSQHYHPVAERALPAVIMGLVGDVGEVGGQRLALPRAFERVHPHDGREQRLWQDLLRQVNTHLAEDDIAVVDAGVKIKDLQAAGLGRYVVRLPTNFTARRNVIMPHTGRGRPPVYGALVRPLPRQRKGKTLDATPADECRPWSVEGRTLRVECWRALVLPTTTAAPTNQTFDVYAFHDPAFKQPWLLATPVPLHAESVHGLYTDRWPVEQLPLAAKHMVGAHRQFVHAPETIQRLPELALLAGSILSFLAATAPASPTGFWDRQPKPTPGRFRRGLFAQLFPKSYPLPANFRKKNTATAHLPKGILAVRSKIGRQRPFGAPSPLLNAPDIASHSAQWTGI